MGNKTTFIATGDSFMTRRLPEIGTCSTFHDSDIAGNQGISMSGRPGLNPLRFNKFFYVTKERFDILNDICRETHMNADKNNAIRLGYSLPHMELPRHRRGWPTVMDSAEVIEYLAELSKPYGTNIEIFKNFGIIHI